MIINQWVFGYTIFRHTHMGAVFCADGDTSKTTRLEDHVDVPNNPWNKTHVVFLGAWLKFLGRPN